jgi:tetratricopeptide (TPR) repeat protein
VISQLIAVAVEQGLEDTFAATFLAEAAAQPDAVVQLLRRHLGSARYHAALHEVFRVRRDPDSERTWTPTQELVCRCQFKAVVTTNYDSGILDARMRVRLSASNTGFVSWTDELALDRWRTGDVFGDEELPVLFAHGNYNRPDAMVLATTEYRRAYAGKLSRVLAQMIDTWHLVWIGFSFSDQHINGVLREVAQHAGTGIDPGHVPRHVAIMAWDPEGGRDPQALQRLAQIQYGADLILYPAPSNDHSALAKLLAAFVVEDYPPAPSTPPLVTAVPKATAVQFPTSSTTSPVSGSATLDMPSPPDLPVRWVPSAETVDHFTGRVEELAKLDRWAADPTVQLIGVTAWGGAGKTALVSHWIESGNVAVVRPAVRGVFGWSFYADPSAERWAQALLQWAEEALGVRLKGRSRIGPAVSTLLREVPLALVLDGLEVLQESPEGSRVGRLLDGTLREVLTGACWVKHGGLVLLTSRFAFSDLEGFDGGSARMLEVPPFTLFEGSALLTASGGGWLPEATRADLVKRVDGHALAVAALGGALADRPPTEDVLGLREELAAAATTNVRVAKVLKFYASRLAEADRYLVAAVALFTYPITPHAVLTVAQHDTFGKRLKAWTAGHVKAAARDRLAGLLSWHPDGTLSAHPLVRDSFRPLALGAAEVAADVSLTSVPEGRITSREDGLRVVAVIELLLSADHWRTADYLWKRRTDNGRAWKWLPAAQTGQRGATAFVATRARQQACHDQLGPVRLGHFLNEVGLHAMNAGDMAAAHEYLDAAIRCNQSYNRLEAISTCIQNLIECLGYMGDIERAQRAASDASTDAAKTRDTFTRMKAEAFEGWIGMLAGDTSAAERHFIAADLIEFRASSDHLYSLGGAWWAEFLARTGRLDPAYSLTHSNQDISARAGWHNDVARCRRLLASLDLAVGNAGSANQRLNTAIITFRDGDLLAELAATLPILADCARIMGDLDSADRHTQEALAIAGPRGLAPSQAVALAVRANTFADRAAGGSRDHLERGRDAANAAYRIAVHHGLAWYELDALNAHVRLDQITGAESQWSQQAVVLRSRLIPTNLSADPLATVERKAARPPGNDG